MSDEAAGYFLIFDVVCFKSYIHQIICDRKNNFSIISNKFDITYDTFTGEPIVSIQFKKASEKTHSGDMVVVQKLACTKLNVEYSYPLPCRVYDFICLSNGILVVLLKKSKRLKIWKGFAPILLEQKDVERDEKTKELVGWLNGIKYIFQLKSCEFVSVVDIDKED